MQLNSQVMLGLVVLAIVGFVSFFRWLLAPGKPPQPLPEDEDELVRSRRILETPRPIHGGWYKFKLALVECPPPAPAMGQAEIKIGDADARPIPHRS